MDQALRNLVDDLGLDLADASLRVSTHAADYLGLADRGRLAPAHGPMSWCSIATCSCKDVFVEGESIDLAHACMRRARRPRP